MNFWDSLNTGFNTGFKYADEAERDQRDFELRKRLADSQLETEGLRQRQYRQQLTQADRVDAARNDLSSALANGVQTGTATGMTPASQRMLFQGGTAYGSGAAAIQEASGDSAREAQRMGMDPAAYSAAGVGTRQASARDILGLRQRLAVAQGLDIAPMIQEGKQLDWTEGYKAKIGEWRSMSPEQRAQYLAQFSKGDDVSGYFSWEQGKGGSGGRYWHMVPGKAPTPLSPDEAEQLYALRNLADVDPERAAKEAAALKGNARKAALDILNAQTHAITANNQAIHFENQDNLQRQHVGQQGAMLKKLQLEEERRAKQEGLAQEAEGYRMGMLRARDAKAGDAERIYGDLYAGAQVRGAGLGLKLGDPYMKEPTELKVNQDGSVVVGKDLYFRDPKNPMKLVKAQGIGPSALDLAIANDAGGAKPPQAQAVPQGRPTTGGIKSGLSQGMSSTENSMREALRMGLPQPQQYDPTALAPTAPGYGQPGYRLR